MAWNGLGVYVLPPAFSPEVNGTIIDAARYNGLTSDVATGITACLNKNGENVPTTAISWGGQRLTNLAAAASAGDALSYGAAASVSNLWLGNTAASFGSVGIGPTASLGARVNIWGDSSAGAGVIDFITAEATQVKILRTASVVNSLALTGSATGARVGNVAQGTDTNIGIALVTKGTGDCYIGPSTGAGLTVNNVASQNRNITITGSNSGNPILGTTAGHIKGTSALRETGFATTANDVAEDYTLLGSDKLCFVDKDEPANGRQVEFVYSGGALTGRFSNDTYTVASNWLIVTGSSAAIAGIAFGGPLVSPTFLGNPAGTVTSGTYTPTMTTSTNVSGITSTGTWHYLRVGNEVTVAGTCSVTCTTASATASVLYASLPIASNLGAVQDLAGSGTRSIAPPNPMEAVVIFADTTNDRALLGFNCLDTNNGTISCSFQYRVI